MERQALFCTLQEIQVRGLVVRSPLSRSIFTLLPQAPSSLPSRQCYSVSRCQEISCGIRRTEKWSQQSHSDCALLHFSHAHSVSRSQRSTTSRKRGLPICHVSAPDVAQSEDESRGSNAAASSGSQVWDSKPIAVLENWKPPRYLWRGLSGLLILGQVVVRVLKGKIHWKNTLQQLEAVGPASLGVALLTASFVGMVFTIQFVREFARLGLTRSVGGVLALALSRELSPVITAIILAGRVGSAFAAELGTMQVSEQTDTLRVLRTDPVDYLVTPRVVACCVAMPVLTLMCFAVGMAASVLLADGVYNVSANIILDSAARALQPWDIISTMFKSVTFGGIVSIISCAWGMTTLGGAKGVGESTTSAVVISLVFIFIADFILSFAFFQGAGDSLKAAMG